MPADIEFLDIRKGSDVEFGQSIYEPFGIAQLEPLTYGSLCVFTGVCGCAGFVRDVTGGQAVRNVLLADYTDLGDHPYRDVEDLLQIDRQVRDRIEAAEAARLAREILERLPKNEAELDGMICEGYRLAYNMSWDVVVRKYLLNDLSRATQKQLSCRN